MRLARLLLALTLIAGIAAARAEARDFSADLVSLDAAGQPSGLNGKVFVSGQQVRIETADVPGGFFVVNHDQATAYFVKPAQRVYMDAKQSSRLTQLLVPLQPGDPCETWQAMAKIAGAADAGGAWRCEKPEQEILGERATVKYQATSPRDQRNDAWIDPSFGFLIRLQGEDGTGFELENVSEGPQPATLFEVPATYQKFDPLRLIELIKKSDVWVEPPKD